MAPPMAPVIAIDAMGAILRLAPKSKGPSLLCVSGARASSRWRRIALAR